MQGDQCPNRNGTYLENCISITWTILQHGFRVPKCNFDVIKLNKKAAALLVCIININNKTAVTGVKVKAAENEVQKFVATLK